MLVGVVDRTGRGGVRKVRAAFEDVEGRFAKEGLALRLPVAAEIAGMPNMGASKSRQEGHTLFVSSTAIRSEMLDGLIAHEMGHMLRTELGHPSHDPRVLGEIWGRVRLPRGGEGVFGQGVNHIQDIYADDLAFLVGLSDRARDFFAGWVRGNASDATPGRWSAVGRSMTNGFALGNLARHGLLQREDGLWEEARAYDRAVGFETVDRFARFYESLPVDPREATIVRRGEELRDLLRRAVGMRPNPAPSNTSPGLPLRPSR